MRFEPNSADVPEHDGVLRSRVMGGLMMPNEWDAVATRPDPAKSARDELRQRSSLRRVWLVGRTGLDPVIR